MHWYFLLNIKHGAQWRILECEKGGALQRLRVWGSVGSPQKWSCFVNECLRSRRKINKTAKIASSKLRVGWGGRCKPPHIYAPDVASQLYLGGPNL